MTMESPDTETDFTRIWRGIRKKVNMSKVMAKENKQEKIQAFKKELAILPLPAKNLQRMNSKNTAKLLSVGLLEKETFLKRKMEKVLPKVKKDLPLTKAERKNLKDYQNLKKTKRKLTKKEIAIGQRVKRARKREQLVTLSLKARKIKIERRIPAKKGKPGGRKPYKAKKAIQIFSRKRPIQGKTKKFKTYGQVSTDIGNFHIIEANLKTGTLRLRNMETGRFANSKSI